MISQPTAAPSQMTRKTHAGLVFPSNVFEMSDEDDDGRNGGKICDKSNDGDDEMSDSDALLVD